MFCLTTCLSLNLIDRYHNTILTNKQKIFRKKILCPIRNERLNPELLQSYISSACREPLTVPVNFQFLHKSTAKHCMKVLVHRRVRINPKFDKLITSSRQPSKTMNIQFTRESRYLIVSGYAFYA